MKCLATDNAYEPSKRSTSEVVCYVIPFVIGLAVTLFLGFMTWVSLSADQYLAGSLTGLFFLISLVKLVAAVEARPWAKKPEDSLVTRGRRVWLVFAAIVYILGALVCLAGLVLKIFANIGPVR